MENVNIVVNPSATRNGIKVYSDMLIKNLDFPYNLIYPGPPKIFNMISRIWDLSFLKAYNTNLNKKINPKELTHFTDQFIASPLFFHKLKSVVTVHDLAFLRYPELWSLATHLKFNRFDRLWHKISLCGLKKANVLIAVSEFTKKEIIELLDYPEERIFVTLEGVGEEFHCQNLKRRENTLLYIGSDSMTKNLNTLIFALSKVKQEIPDIKLINIGSSQWPRLRAQLNAQIMKFGLEKNVIFKGYTENLISNYNKATIFVFPPIYEGFGLPILEAMACGCPVICSNTASLPEVAGDASIYFNPKNPIELAEKIIRLLKSENLRKRLSRMGLKRAKQFTWKKTAQKTVEIYEKIK